MIDYILAKKVGTPVTKVLEPCKVLTFNLNCRFQIIRSRIKPFLKAPKKQGKILFFSCNVSFKCLPFCLKFIL